MKRRARKEYQSSIREVAVVPGEIKGEEVNDASSIMCVDETELCRRIPAQILTVSELYLFSSATNEKNPGCSDEEQRRSLECSLKKI